MKIERLELKGYQRLLLNNIDEVVYEPQSTYQLILGTNGSGKSSILAELSPLPAQPNRYARGGYKRILLQHRQRHYELTSRFESHNKHSFLCGDQELNPGGTAEVQRLLVREHFGLDQDLFGVLTGLTRFTDMSPSQRRSWITRLSTVDFSWAIGLHKRLATLARDNQGALKHVRARLVTESSNLAALGADEGDEQVVAQLTAELNALLTQRTPNAASSEAIHRQITGVLAEVQRLSQSANDMLTPMVRYNGYRNTEDLTRHLEESRSELALRQGMLSSMSSEYASMEALASTVDLGCDLTPQGVDFALQSARADVLRLLEQPQPFGDFTWTPARAEATSIIEQPLAQLLLALPDNTDRRYSRERKAQLREQLQTTQQQVDGRWAQLRRVYRQIEHIETAVESTCPQCGHRWKEGHSPETSAQLREQHAQLQAELDQGQTQIAKIEEALQEQDGVEQLYHQFKALVGGYPVLQPLWDYLMHNRYYLEAPASHVQVVSQWQQALARQREIQTLRERIERLEDLQAQLLGDGSLHIAQRMAHLAEQISQVSQQISQSQQAVQSAESLRRTLLSIDQLCVTLQGLRDRYTQLVEQLVNALRNEAIDRLTQTHQQRLAELTRKMTDRKVLTGIVNDLKASETQVDERYQAYRLLADSLSPTEGLIAEQLSGFIRCFTDQLNSVIAAIWAHDFVILPCSISEGELDYKFPLQIKSPQNRAPDISEGSKAQQQAVNLAFQFAVMLYQGMEDFPLYLDEPGEGFDEQHRINLMSFIRQLMDTQNHPQLFMISHYASNHGAFTNADVMVLDASNIAVPGHYNQHVTLR